MSEHWSRDIKATRKQHVCEQCNTYIEAGSPARYAFGIYEGDTYSFHVHVECQDAAREFAKLYGEEWPWFQHMDDSEFEHHAWLLENHPLVAGRLGIKCEVAA